MKMGLLACISLSALISVAQAAPESGSASGPLRLSAPQMDTATAGIASVWINNAARGLLLGGSNGFSTPGYAGICCGPNANIQLVFKISGLPSQSPGNSQGVIISSQDGVTISSGTTIIGRNIQMR